MRKVRETAEGKGPQYRELAIFRKNLIYRSVFMAMIRYFQVATAVSPAWNEEKRAHDRDTGRKRDNRSYVDGYEKKSGTGDPRISSSTRCHQPEESQPPPVGIIKT